MNNKKAWLEWINDQLEDMNNDDSYSDTGNNRVFKSERDDREVAEPVLQTFKDVLINYVLD